MTEHPRTHRHRGGIARRRPVKLWMVNRKLCKGVGEECSEPGWSHLWKLRGKRGPGLSVDLKVWLAWLNAVCVVPVMRIPDWRTGTRWARRGLRRVQPLLSMWWDLEFILKTVGNFWKMWYDQSCVLGSLLLWGKLIVERKNGMEEMDKRPGL